MKNNKCKHEWVEMKDGSRDVFCVKCSKKAMRNAAYLENTEPNPSMMRQTVTINMGGHLGSVDVYKDKILDEISKSIKLKLSSRSLR